MAEVSPAGARTADNSNKKRKHPPNSSSFLNDEMQSEKHQQPRQRQKKKEVPILFLNVGGVNKNVRRSLFNQLNDRGGGNPLCNLVLKGTEHWSDVPTIDDDGTIRLYLDRNPEAFDDLLEYIEYGKLFLEKIIGGGGRCGKGDNNTRLMRLQMECDFWTVDSLSKDIQDVMFGEAVTFRSDDWFSVAAKCTRHPEDEDEITGWYWGNLQGNESIAGTLKEGSPRRSLAMCEVERTGTYLVFFSLHSVAVTALNPGHGYHLAEDDECCQLSVFHDKTTQGAEKHWAYPLIRCGAFDYRENDEERCDEPHLFTATVAEPIGLKKGMQLYTTHGAGVVCSPFPNRTTRIVREETPFSEKHPHCANFITLIQVFGDSITKWYVKREKDPKSKKPSTVKWMPAPNDFPAPKSAYMGVSLDVDDDTKIRFKAAGYYLLLGRVASRLKEKPVFTGIHELISAVQLELRTKGELPLQVNPGVVNYQTEYSWNEDERVPYNEKMVEYGNINDIVYAETDSYVSVKAIGRACFACHGAAPDPFQKIPTQSLSAIRLGDMRVDRYEVSYINYANNISYVRSIGGSESVPRKGFLFEIEASTGDLIALETCRCIIVGSLPSSAGPTISLLKNNTEIVNSQLCEGGHGSHTLNTVVEFKASDSLSIRKERWTNCWEAGHLAFIVLG